MYLFFQEKIQKILTTPVIPTIIEYRRFEKIGIFTRLAGYIMKKAVSYYRTSSLANVGDGKDSFKRQDSCCEMYSKRNKMEIVNSFYDAGVSGKVSVVERPEFKRMIVWCKDNDVSTILIEKADRFSRDIVGQEIAYRSMTDMGFDIFSASGDVKYEDDIHSSLMRQIVGAWSEYERKSIAMRLYVARTRKEKENKEKGYLTLSGEGKCGGRKSYQETDKELIRQAKRLARRNPLTKNKRSFRVISSVLFDLGYKTSKNTHFTATQVKRMVAL